MTDVDALGTCVLAASAWLMGATVQEGENVAKLEAAIVQAGELLGLSINVEGLSADRLSRRFG